MLSTVYKRLKLNLIQTALGLIILLILASTGLIFFYSKVVTENRLLRQRAEQVKTSITTNYTLVIRQIDVSIRGYAIGREERFLYISPRQIQSIFDSTNHRLDSLLALQHYNDPAGIQAKENYRNEVQKYIHLYAQMADLIRKDSMDQFLVLFKEDHGKLIGPYFDPFLSNMYQFEDQLLQQAEERFQFNLQAMMGMLLALSLLGSPVAIWVMRTLRKDAANRKQLLEELAYNNRHYIFDPGTVTVAAVQAEDVIHSSIENFKQATQLIQALTVGDYTTQWQGLNEQNRELNKQTLAGELLTMQVQLRKLRDEESQRNWMNEGLALFSGLVRNHQDNAGQLADQAIKFLSKYLNAQQGSLFVVRQESDQSYLELAACYAFDRKKFVNKRVAIGEGLVGQTYLEQETVLLTQIPQGYTTITSGLGDATPTCLVVVPLKSNGKVEAIVELAAFQVWKEYQIQFLEKAGEFIASAIVSARTAQMTSHLLAESQQQAEMLKAQEEEMRQNLEELSATQEQMRRREAEAQNVLLALQTLNNAFATIEFDMQGNVLAANTNFLTLMEYAADEIRSLHHRRFVDQTYAKSADYTQFWRDLNNGKLYTGEVIRYTKTGRAVWLQVSYAPVLNSDGVYYKVLKYAQDITERKMAVVQPTHELAAS
jgi:PAS domain S-box-containing protein